MQTPDSDGVNVSDPVITPRLHGNSVYTDALAESICDAIANGASLRKICEQPDMPDRMTVLRWVETVQGFAAKYGRAREAQGDYMDDLILDTADTTTSENAPASRVKIDAYKWRAAKLKPKAYGDKIAHVGGGETDPPIRVEAGVKVYLPDNGRS